MSLINDITSQVVKYNLNITPTGTTSEGLGSCLLISIRAIKNKQVIANSTDNNYVTNYVSIKIKSPMNLLQTGVGTANPNPVNAESYAYTTDSPEYKFAVAYFGQTNKPSYLMIVHCIYAQDNNQNQLVDTFNYALSIQRQYNIDLYGFVCLSVNIFEASDGLTALYRVKQINLAKRMEVETRSYFLHCSRTLEVNLDPNNQLPYRNLQLRRTLYIEQYYYDIEYMNAAIAGYALGSLQPYKLSFVHTILNGVTPAPYDIDIVAYKQARINAVSYFMDNVVFNSGITRATNWYLHQSIKCDFIINRFVNAIGNLLLSSSTDALLLDSSGINRVYSVLSGVVTGATSDQMIEADSATILAPKVSDITQTFRDMQKFPPFTVNFRIPQVAQIIEFTINATK